MSDPWALQSGPGCSSSPAAAKEEWEEWEDDEVLTPMTARDGPLLDLGPGSAQEPAAAPASQPRRRASRRASSSTARQSVQRIRRLRSRQRQKAQNARAGIRLVTDMSKFRQQQQQQQHMASQMRPDAESGTSRTGKFVDAAALRALEGAPSDESIGTFAWLKRRPTKGKRVERLAAESSPQADLSPGAGPIVIGFEMPSDSNVVISPHTAVVETPVDFPPYFSPPKPASPTMPTSAWSPDTEDEVSPMEAGSSRVPDRDHVPAVPSIPSHYYRNDDVSPLTATTPIYVSEDDDMGTPVTLFEEDGSPATTRRKSFRFKGRQRPATMASSRSQGWWDQVTTPFETPTPATPRTAGSNGPRPDESQPWWRDVDKKKPLSPLFSPRPEAESSRGPRSTPQPQPQPQSPPQPQPHRPPEIIVEDATSAMPSSSSRPTPIPAENFPRPEKPRMTSEEAEVAQTPGELPPPYSPPSRPHNVRYRAIFPPGHPLNAMYPPSPGPVPPGLSHTMTSQGAIGLTDVPLTPAAAATHPDHHHGHYHYHHAPLPDRPPGSFLPGDHFVDVSGRGPRQKAERRRRRHEKEDVVAWKAGRMWRGRGCFPRCCGCIGRPGREGRKRRRWCLGVCVALLVLAAAGAALGVLLTRRAASEQQQAVPSRWLNLTDFPPIPTGISTVVGPESVAKTACVQPPTLWACSLPKEQAGSVAPFDASQPTFVFRIEFDNDTRRPWDIGGQETPVPTPIPTPTPTSSSRALPMMTSGVVASLLRRLAAGVRRDGGASSRPRFAPDPPPPSFQEMFFLGNTTDGVVSDDKAGEPTPFYISVLRSVNDTVGEPEAPLPRTRRRAADRDGETDPVRIPPPGHHQASLAAGAEAGLFNVSHMAPPPALDADGTGAPAVLLPFPTQQPLRLYDRGLPTERYAFYTYYNKTTYLRSVDPLAGGAPPVPADLDGGARKTEARFLVTWLSVRYKVEIWTRRAGSARLLLSSGAPVAGAEAAGVEEEGEMEMTMMMTRPGTLPYPVTITLDTHGGEPGKKFAFVRGVDDRQRIVLDDARFVLNNINTTGDLVNPAAHYNPSFGGMDGGTGGCRCEYTNFVAVHGRA